MQSRFIAGGLHGRAPIAVRLFALSVWGFVWRPHTAYETLAHVRLCGVWTNMLALAVESRTPARVL